MGTLVTMGLLFVLRCLILFHQSQPEEERFYCVWQSPWLSWTKTRKPAVQGNRKQPISSRLLAHVKLWASTGGRLAVTFIFYVGWFARELGLGPAGIMYGSAPPATHTHKARGFMWQHGGTCWCRPCTKPFTISPGGVAILSVGEIRVRCRGGWDLSIRLISMANFLYPEFRMFHKDPTRFFFCSKSFSSSGGHRHSLRVALLQRQFMALLPHDWFFLPCASWSYPCCVQQLVHTPKSDTKSLPSQQKQTNKPTKHKIKEAGQKYLDLKFVVRGTCTLSSNIIDFCFVSMTGSSHTSSLVPTVSHF